MSKHAIHSISLTHSFSISLRIFFSITPPPPIHTSFPSFLPICGLYFPLFNSTPTSQVLFFLFTKLPPHLQHSPPYIYSLSLPPSNLIAVPVLFFSILTFSFSLSLSLCPLLSDHLSFFVVVLSSQTAFSKPLYS